MSAPRDMETLFRGRRILLGITGSIAAYKVLDWLRELRRLGAEVQPVLTEAATRFVPPLSVAALSGQRVFVDMFDPDGAETIPHIRLGRDTDCILVAPASAQTIARLAHGLADNLLAAATLASAAPVVICPAMNSGMFTHPATQENLKTLRGRGCVVVEPAHGAMACGEEGPGRLPEWDRALDALATVLSPHDLAGLRLLVTAGPTRESLDPVRFLGNRATGRMGYALARAAAHRGATVTLVHGPSSVPPPMSVDAVPVDTALEMRDAVLRHAPGMDVIIKAAAVSDYRPASVSPRKIKKTTDALQLDLVRNPDILAELGRMRAAGDLSAILVGFAAESEDLAANAAAKLRAKGLDLVAANDITAAGSGFAATTNRVLLVDHAGLTETLPLLSKYDTAGRILDRVAALRSRAAHTRPSPKRGRRRT